ncbi:hypothetical protein L0Y59_04210 [Candidatus Uhrbacteria bacterium]|nr:hypothetical protein [Candidatus Uhrbacteria bacterium]
MGSPKITERHARIYTQVEEEGVSSWNHWHFFHNPEDKRALDDLESAGLVSRTERSQPKGCDKYDEYSDYKIRR